MATKTTNYNLTKPSGSESADIDVINANMDIIDNALGTKANKSEIPDVSGFANKSDLTNLATKSEIPDVSGYLPLAGGTMSGRILIANDNPYIGFTNSTKTAYAQMYKPSDAEGWGCYLGFGYRNSMKIDESGNIYGVASIYQNGKQVANKEEIPNITASTTDIGEGSSLATGTLYLVYE